MTGLAVVGFGVGASTQSLRVKVTSILSCTDGWQPRHRHRHDGEPGTADGRRERTQLPLAFGADSGSRADAVRPRMAQLTRCTS